MIDGIVSPKLQTPNHGQGLNVVESEKPLQFSLQSVTIASSWGTNWGPSCTCQSTTSVAWVGHFYHLARSHARVIWSFVKTSVSTSCIVLHTL